MALLDQLNPRQREAAQTTEGPLLVLAGAGTGKTRVITYRAAYLIARGVEPGAILCVTFTNKAAEQMKARIGNLLRSSGRDASDVWISTFHSFAARLLREEAGRLRLPRDFAIYDEDQQTSAVKLALQELNRSERDFSPRSLRDQISHAKNHGIPSGEMDHEFAEVFEAYEGILHRAGALDFDDLLLRSAALLREHADARAAWNSRFPYIQVDEFQDTNATQEELVRLLAGQTKNVCVVGDEDQSIYSWRGARAGNMKRFTEDFPKATIVRLEENYRSTQTILDAAAGVVAHNRERLGKNLVATKGAGNHVRFFEAHDAAGEAEFICGEIAERIREDQDTHLAVLYRTTAQSRGLEECLRRLGIRYRVVGGFSFYERAEVRDALSYLRLIFHPEDDIALLRVLNVPPRGIGTTTEAALRMKAQERRAPPKEASPLLAPHGAEREEDVSLWDVLPEFTVPGTLASSAALRKFQSLIECLQRDVRELQPEKMLRAVLDRTGYLAWAEQQDHAQNTSRVENLGELVNAMAEATEAGQTLQDVLDQAALVSAADDYDEDVRVTLMTLHAAKGLEFDHVFLAGLEEGLLPHSRSTGNDEDIEEERRLCYVGMTRARSSLTLSRALYRRTYDEERLRTSAPSRFLAEIPGDLIETVAGSLAEAGETLRYEPDPEYYQYRQRPSGRGASSRGNAVRSFGARPKAAHPLVGTRVRHPKFGLGTIISVDDDEEDRLLTVSFLDHGTKKLKERYANLQIA